MPTKTWFKVDVTQDDINNGIQQSCSSCPIGIAIYRTLGVKTSQVGVRALNGFTEIYTRNGYFLVWYHSEDAVQDFMTKFDRGKTVQPRQFIMYSMGLSGERIEHLKSNNLLVHMPKTFNAMDA